jgi:hypothetical protein
VVASLFCPHLQREGIRARAGLAQCVGADSVGREPGKKKLLLLRRGPTQQGIDAKRILHVDQHAHGWVDGGDLFHSKNGLEEGSSGPTVLDGNLDAHQAEIEELRNQLGVKVLLFVHGANQGRDIFLRKLANSGTKELFIFRKQGEGGSGLRCKNGICHGNKAIREMPACPAGSHG